jgi:hypothetical protein
LTSLTAFWYNHVRKSDCDLRISIFARQSPILFRPGIFALN